MTARIENEWLEEIFSLKGGKGIIAVIEAADQEYFGKNSTTFKRASLEINAIRNATFPRDLTITESQADAHSGPFDYLSESGFSGLKDEQDWSYPIG